MVREQKYLIIAALLRAGRPELANIVAAHRVVAAKTLQYHGTSSVRAKRILAEGMVPNAKKVWDKGHLKSYGGIYFTTSLKYASRMANEAAAKHGGIPVVFEVQLETRTALLDEDALPDIWRFMPHGQLLQLARRDTKQFARKRSKHQASMVEQWMEWLRKRLHRPLHPAAEKRIRPLLANWANRVMEEVLAGRLLEYDDEDMTDEPFNMPPRMKALHEKLVKTIGQIAKLKDEPRARVLEPITFRGANRLLAGIARPPVPYPQPAVYHVFFGKPSSSMIQALPTWMDDWGERTVVRTMLSKIPDVKAPPKYVPLPKKAPRPTHKPYKPTPMSDKEIRRSIYFRPTYDAWDNFYWWYGREMPISREQLWKYHETNFRKERSYWRLIEKQGDLIERDAKKKEQKKKAA